MTPATFISFAQGRHGDKWIQPMADETGYSYDQIYGIAHRGRPVGKRLEKIVSKLPTKRKRLKIPLSGAGEEGVKPGRGT